MRFQNPVKSHAVPWFMDEAATARRLPELPAHVRPYVEELVRDGVTVIKSAVPKAICATLVGRFKALAALNMDKFGKFLDKDGHYPRIANLHAAMPELFDLFAKNSVAYDVQSAMFGATPCLYTSLFYERGSAQDIHRDSPYFCTKPENFYLGVWVALEEARHENGALNVIRGGHRIPEPDRKAIALKHFPTLEALPSSATGLWDDYQAEVQRLCAAAGLKKTSIYAQPGDTIIWHPQLPHGGGEILDFTQSRFSFVMHTTPVGMPVYHHDKFFNPAAPAAMDVNREYEVRDQRHFLAHSQVDFAHQELFAAHTFKQPA
jgi:ectoine hydroxylase-related dioxygenase (phytanoyl-CoA dioxygenase family)